MKPNHKTRGAIIVRKEPKEPTAFEKLCQELDDAERASAKRADRTTDVEYNHRMSQAQRLRKVGKMSAESVAALQRIMLGGQLPKRIGDALDRACGE